MNHANAKLFKKGYQAEKGVEVGPILQHADCPMNLKGNQSPTVNYGDAQTTKTLFPSPYWQSFEHSILVPLC